MWVVRSRSSKPEIGRRTVLFYGLEANAGELNVAPSVIGHRQSITEVV